jgi:putative spermidine/putrescine transport system substrate-binding protein
VWWEKGSQPPQLLASGEVAMTDAYNGRIAAANDKDKKNFKIVWTNNLYTIDSWVIMKGTPNKAQAETFLVFVNDPQNQKNLPPKIPYGPTAKASTALIDKNVLPNLATAPQNIASALYINDKFWLENLDKLNQRFNAWVAK